MNSISTWIAIIGLATNTATVLILIWQVRSMRAETRAKSHVDMASRWGQIALLETSDPSLHRMMLGPRASAAIQDLNDKQISEHAFVQMVFDVVTQKFRLEKELGNGKLAYRYLNILMSNPEIRRHWFEHEVREAWDGDPLQETIDKAGRKFEAQASGNP